MNDTRLMGSKLFAQIARDIASQPGTATAMDKVVETTRSLVGCAAVAVWERTGGSGVAYRASTDQRLASAMRVVLRELDGAPVLHSLVDGDTCLVRDVDADPRWPRYAAGLRAKNLRVRSVLTFPLAICNEQHGSLALYDPRADYFSPALVDLAGVMADHAAVALHGVHAEEEAANLRIALESNRRIGVAVGILVALHHISADEAFDMLRTASQHNHQRLRDLAEEVILTGEVPATPSRRPAA